MDDLIERLEEVSLEKSRGAFDCAQCGIEANLVERVIDALKSASAENGKLQKQNERLTRIVQDFDHLIGESGGVYGLHLNGDNAPWSEIMPGGRFEEWLIHYGDPITESEPASSQRSENT